jgi:hypothetical protein
LPRSLDFTYGGTLIDFSLILDLVARELAIKQTSYCNINQLLKNILTL